MKLNKYDIECIGFSADGLTYRDMEDIEARVSDNSEVKAAIANALVAVCVALKLPELD